MGEPFVHEFRVRWGGCDPQGIVFNANELAESPDPRLLRAGLAPYHPAES